MSIEIKRGDDAVIHWAFGMDVSDYTEARFVMKALGAEEAIVVELDVPIDDEAVDIHLSPTDTAIAGEYQAEVELLPGPHTWPSGSFVTIIIVGDLA